MLRLAGVVAPLLLYAECCSNFAMENDYRLSGRTDDNGDWSRVQVLATSPRKHDCLRSCRHGYVAAIELKENRALQFSFVLSGMNTAGLSCDRQYLPGSRCPGRNSSLDNIDVGRLCQWALEGFGSVAELKAGLRGVNFIGHHNCHWALRDARGEGVVIEFLEGTMRVHDDNNDGGKTGFGMMTNEPSFQWQLEAVRNLKTKQSRARPAVTMPGTWYPDARFQRGYLIKSAMPTPASYEEAVAQVAQVMNSLSVPKGAVIGTDSGSGEGLADRTQWGIIYDHVNQTMYWRTEGNQNFQRLRLSDAQLADSGPSLFIRMASPELPFFHDAAAGLSPAPSRPDNATSLRGAATGPAVR